ncbi:MAG TPA: hypothetical protein VH227_01325 [Candidatus Udaeobacter sp.]|jgi:hypothetical protein|nr:hypothetical protein [Candidatus Udaeobacter sp.]
MSELIRPPSNWKFRLNLDAATLTSQLGKQRLLCVKSFLLDDKRVYCAVSVEDGQGNAWDGRITKTTLKTTLGKKFRLTALDCFEEKENVLRCGVGQEFEIPLLGLGHRLHSKRSQQRY